MRSIAPKFHILKFIWQQGIVSVDDVTRHLYQPNNFKAVRIIMYRLGLAHAPYKDIKHGVWFIDKPELFELLNYYFPELPLTQNHTIPVSQYLHYLGINRIRTTLEKSDQINVDEWWSENYIRNLPSSVRSKFGENQTPDAVFWVKRKDGGRQQFFLEFERSLKAKDRYEEIFTSYAKCPGVQKRNVLYVCQTPHIREELLSIEAKMVRDGKLSEAGQYFQFVTLASFNKTYGNELSNEEESNENNKKVAQAAEV